MAQVTNTPIDIEYHISVTEQTHAHADLVLRQTVREMASRATTLGLSAHDIANLLESEARLINSGYLTRGLNNNEL